MFMDRKSQYYQDVSSSRLDLVVKHNPNKNSSKLFSEIWQADSKIYGERPKGQNNQHNIEEELSQNKYSWHQDYKVTILKTWY